VRGAFVEALISLAREDERIHLLTADLGWSVIEPFARAFPGRFLNTGVAEANMAGIATGLAQLGAVPFIYSIATFSSMRCYEQVRNGPVRHRLPVRIVGVGGGFAYGHAGPTHFALEDLALARTQPGLAAIAPADPAQTRAVVRASLDWPGPAYLRIGKGGNQAVPGLEGRFALDRPELIREGRDLLLLCCGGVAVEAVAAAEALAAQGFSAAVAVLAHLSFAPSPALVELLGRFERVLAVEEGYGASALGALAAQAIALNGLRCRLGQSGVFDSPPGISGSEAWMRTRHGLDAPGIAAAARALASLSE